MELNLKSTESIIEVNLFGKLNYNKLPHLLLNSNCGNWKTVYIYKKNIGGGNRMRSPNMTTPHNYFLPLNMTFELRHKTVTMESLNIHFSIQCSSDQLLSSFCPRRLWLQRTIGTKSCSSISSLSNLGVGSCGENQFGR